MSTGTNVSIGPVVPPSQPFWKMAVTTPKAAPADSRFITAAVSGMSRLRNTAINSKKLSRTTIPMNNGSLAERMWLKSSKIAVVPPTRTVSPVARVAAGIT